MFSKRKVWLSILVMGLILVGTLGYPALALSNVKAGQSFLVGSWNVDITAVQQNARFPGLMTFFSDGNLISDETPSPLETSGHGDWVKIRSNEAAFTFVAVVGNPDPTKWARFTVNGKATYKPKTDQWSGPYTIVVKDQDGNILFTDSGTMVGTRISARP